MRGREVLRETREEVAKSGGVLRETREEVAKSGDVWRESRLVFFERSGGGNENQLGLLVCAWSFP